MIKRTIYFGNPAYLSKKNDQLFVQYPERETDAEEEVRDVNAQYKARSNQNSIPIEDIGIVILDNPQITVTQSLMSTLLENNAAIITCDKTHHPAGLLLPLESHQTQNERFRAQIKASEPLKKQLWQQTITAKVMNQAGHLRKQNKSWQNMAKWAKTVKSGDTGNVEARAAAYYWKTLLPEELEFTRERYGEPPNNLLNYGYAILRAVVARALVASGLLPTLGIHHHNKYNAFCLADDIMEPYRPYVDEVVLSMLDIVLELEELTTELKKKLLAIPTLTIMINGQYSPLMVGVQQTTASLAKCFEGETRKLIYPEF